jgi:hypothetical protein
LEEGEKWDGAISQGENADELDKEFASQKVNYRQAILPIVRKRRGDFIDLLAMQQATHETVKEYRKFLKRYERPLRLISEKEAPFPQELKEQLKISYAAVLLQPKALQDQFLQIAQEVYEEPQGKKILDNNINKSWSKQPLWQELMVELFQLLKKKKVSDRQAYRLISQLFHSLIPNFDALYPEDTIRLTVQRHLNALRASSSSPNKVRFF